MRHFWGEFMRAGGGRRKYLVVGAVCLLAVLSLTALLVRSPALPPDAGSVARVRLMTGQQFANSIAYIFGSDITVGSVFAPLQRTDGLLALSTSSVGVTSGQMQDFHRAAASIAAQVTDDGNSDRGIPSHRDSLVPCKPAALDGADDQCAEKFIRGAGRLLFRRPLSEDKVAELVAEANQAATGLDDFYGGLASVLEGMLINPMVLLIEDTTEPDPKRPDARRLDAFALASRLSFLLWNAVPDDPLLKAAESGELHTRKGRQREVRRMLASPRLEDGVRAFFDDMFAFDKFDALSKDPTAYPMVTGATLQDAREQTLRTIVDHLLTKEEDYRDLFTTRDTFISQNLGPVYKVAAVPGWSPYEMPADSGRAGILTHVSFLTLHAHPARSSPTLRGQALRELFLCQKVPPPPPDVDFSAIEDPDASLRTARERLAVHRSNPSCAGCHKITDPMGLALESFDGAGLFRTTENGAPIDTSGDLDGIGFTTAVELGDAMKANPGLPTCLVQRLYSYATGGTVTPREPMIVALSERFAKADYRVKELLYEIAMSEAFSRIIEAPAPASVLAGNHDLPLTEIE